MSTVYRVLGVIWFILGILFIVVAIGFMVAAGIINEFFRSSFPVFSGIVGGLLFDLSKQAPLLHQLLGLLAGAFLIYYGMNLARLKSWTRTVGIPFHGGVGVAVISLGLLLFRKLEQAPMFLDLPGWVSYVILLLFFLFGVGLIAAGAWLVTRGALQLFAGSLNPRIPYQKVECPKCQAQMDVLTDRCPNCDRDEEIVPPGRPRLVDFRAGREYPVFTVNRTTRIGRERGFEVPLDDVSVSADHAEIEYTDGFFYLHAHKDTNGTYVNGNQIRDYEIKHADTLQFGRVEMKFLTED